MRPPVNPGRVTWAGDHLLLALRRPGATTDTTYVSYYRTTYSAVGSGYTALVITDPTGTGQGRRPIRAIFTDNLLLTDWVRQHLTRRPGHPFREPDLPIIEARFETSGAVGQVWRETIHVLGDDAQKYAPAGGPPPAAVGGGPPTGAGVGLPRRIDLTWQGFETPLYLEAPRGVIGQDYDIFSLICPARSGTVVIDGVAEAGTPYLNEAWTRSTGQPRSSALVAVCEVLIELDMEEA